MPLRRCIEPGCTELTARTRCPNHQQQRQTARGYTTEYKQRHRTARRDLAPLVATCQALCSRCHLPILPTEDWDADQRPWGFEPAHQACNRSAGAKHLP